MASCSQEWKYTMAVRFDLGEQRFVDEDYDPPWPSDKTPLRLLIANTDILRWRINTRSDWIEWLGVPPHYFARSGIYAVRQAIQFGRSAIDANGSGFPLMFMKSGNRLLVHQPGGEITVSVRSDEILTAWLEFENRIRSLIRLYCPEFASEAAIAKHADMANDVTGWIGWLDGGEDPVAGWSFNWNWRTNHEACFQRVDAVDE